MPNNDHQPQRGDRFSHARLPGVCTVERVTRDRVQYRNDRDGVLYSKPAAVFTRVVARWLDEEQDPASP